MGNNEEVTYQILTAVCMKMMFRVVFWDILPCKMIVDRRFRDAYCLHHQVHENVCLRDVSPCSLVEIK
jgi:hypothetical protein